MDSTPCVRTTSVVTFTAAFVLLTLANKAAFDSPCGSTIVLTISALQQLFVVVLVMAQSCVSDYMGRIEYSWTHFVRVLPVGLLSAVDVGLTNFALRLLPLSIFQIVKCLTPAFVLVLGFMFGTSKPSWVLGLSIVLIVGGSAQSVVSSMDATHPNTLPTRHGSHHTTPSQQQQSMSISGLVVLVTAIAASSLRTVVSQLLVQKGQNSQLPAIPTASATFHSAVQMLVVISVAAVFFEHQAVVNFRNCEPVPLEMYWIAVTVALAYLVSVMTFWLTLVTSALTTALCSLVQRVATVLLAVAVLHETVPSASWVGFFISLAGILLYNFEAQVALFFRGSSDETRQELEPIAHSAGKSAYGATEEPAKS